MNILAMAGQLQPSNQQSDSVETSNTDLSTGTPDDGHFDAIDWLAFAATTVVIAAVYFSTMAPEVTLEYSGMLSTGATYAAVSNPPGYPLWTIYSWLFVKLLPFSNIAWRVAMGSSAAMAIACGLVTLMVSYCGKMWVTTVPAFRRWRLVEQYLLRMTCGYVAGMSFGLSTSIWREAIIADTWSLTLLLFAVMLCLLMRWTFRPKQKRLLYLTFFVFGLLLTGNQELILVTPGLLMFTWLNDPKLGRDAFLIIPPLIVAEWPTHQSGLFSLFNSYTTDNWPLLAAFIPAAIATVTNAVKTRRLGSEIKGAITCLVALFLGLGLYFYLPIASLTTPPADWGYPRTVEGFFHLINRGQFERCNPTHDLDQFITECWVTTKAIGNSFGWIYLILAIIPTGLLLRSNPRVRRWMCGLVAIFLCTGPLMVATLNPDTNQRNMEFLLPSLGTLQIILAIGTGLGLIMTAGILHLVLPNTVRIAAM